MEDRPLNPVAFVSKRLGTKASIALAEDLQAAIVRGALEPGTRLPSEEALMRQSGHSRATVRESMRVLEREGLIEIRRGPTGGSFVRRPDHVSIARSLQLLLQFNRNDPKVILEARRELEPLCARLAAARVSREEIGRLRGSVDRLQALHDSGEAARENLVFHLTLVEASRNSVLQAVVAAVRSLLYDSSIKVYYSREKILQAAKAHAKIVDALEERNASLAAARMVKHLVASERYLVESRQVALLTDGPEVPNPLPSAGVTP